MRARPDTTLSGVHEFANNIRRWCEIGIGNPQAVFDKAEAADKS